MHFIKTLFLFLLGFFFLACNSNTHSATEKKYKLGLHLQTGTRYYYIINNQTDISLTINNKKTENENNAIVGLLYDINKDSANNFLFKITYDSIHIVMKKEGKTTEFDASNGVYSVDPIERMLGVLKGNSLYVTINKAGKIISVTGYKEIADNLITKMHIEDESEKQQVQAQLSSMTGEGFVKNNLEQSFNIFPDSALYIGDTWTKNITASTELALNLSTDYKLTSVHNNVAEMKSISNINMNNQAINVIGVQATATLKGSEEGNLKMDTNTGMILQADSKVFIKGNIETMGRKVPISIDIIKTVKQRSN